MGKENLMELVPVFTPIYSPIVLHLSSYYSYLTDTSVSETCHLLLALHQQVSKDEWGRSECISLCKSLGQMLHANRIPILRSVPLTQSFVVLSSVLESWLDCILSGC